MPCITSIFKSHDSHVTRCLFPSHCSNNESVVQEVRALEEQAFTLPKFILKKVQELMQESIGELTLVQHSARVYGDSVHIVTSYGDSVHVVTSYSDIIERLCTHSDTLQ